MARLLRTASSALPTRPAFQQRLFCRNASDSRWDLVGWWYSTQARYTFGGLEVWIANDIVSNIQHSRTDAGKNDILINPANAYLCGTKFPYFPRGGPVPQHPRGMLGDDIRLSNQWGGMEAGPGMLYPSQTVDGSVHVAGGKELFRSLQDQFNELRTTKQVDKLPPGHVVLTQPSGRLRSACGYDLIAHVVSPLRNEHNNDSIGVLNGESRNGGGGGGYDEDDDDDDDNNRGIEALYVLQCSYRNVFSLVRETNSVADGSDGAQRMRVITTPLIGAGCGGYSTEESVQAMLKAVSENWHFDVRDSDNCRYHPDYDDADTSTNETDYLSAYLPAKLDKDSSLLRIVVRSRHDADVLMTQFLRMKAMNKYLDEA